MDFKNPILFIEFAQNASIQMALCAETDAQKVKGIAMFVKPDASTAPTRTTDYVLNDLFRTEFSKSTKPDTYLVRLRPLTEDVIVTQKTNKFVAQYAFAATRQLGVISKVRVNATESPLRLEFEVFATYRASKDAAPTELRETIVCPDEFTQQLYNFFMRKNQEK